MFVFQKWCLSCEAHVQFCCSQKHFAATANALLLKRSMINRIWDQSKQQCRQMSNVGRVLAGRLTEHGFGTLQSLAAAEPRTIERAAQKPYPVSAIYVN